MGSGCRVRFANREGGIASGLFGEGRLSNTFLPEAASHCLQKQLVLLLTDLLAVALAGECFFNPLLFTWLQVKRVTLHFLDDVFGLNLALEAAQCVLKRFTFLNTNLCQGKYTSKPSLIGSANRIRRIPRKRQENAIFHKLERGGRLRFALYLNGFELG